MKRTVTLLTTAQPDDQGLFRLTGELPLRLSEFGLNEPPGQIADDIAVSFSWRVRRSEARPNTGRAVRKAP